MRLAKSVLVRAEMAGGPMRRFEGLFLAIGWGIKALQGSFTFRPGLEDAFLFSILIKSIN